jgi:hypothetical protein
MTSFAAETTSKKAISRGVLGQHDVGGVDALIKETLPKGSSDMDTAQQYWEKQIHTSVGLLVAQGTINVHELRSGIEDLPDETYLEWNYYEKW